MKAHSSAAKDRAEAAAEHAAPAPFSLAGEHAERQLEQAADQQRQRG
jgi:hypothetical protein